MVRTDWNRILALNAASLTDEEIEDLCPSVIQCDVDELKDVHSLRTLIKLSQEMLQYKDNQVEALLLECGELKETVSSLRPEAAKRKRTAEHDILNGKQVDTSIGKLGDVPDTFNYDDTLRTKTEKVATLMSELETLDKENELLKDRLIVLKEEMEDATEKMNEITEELSTAQIKNSEFKERISELEQENTALAAQIEELTTQQIDRDKVIDDFGAAIDDRIAEWKCILDEKDAEIIRLKENLSQSLMYSVTSLKEDNKLQIVHLNEEIDRRGKVIEELQAKLSEAVVEINDGATMIEKLKADAKKAGKSDKRKQQKELLKKLQDANEKISILQNELIQSQEDAKLRSSKLCEALATLRKYEDENNALTEALAEVKQLQSELHHKNEHIRDLVNIINKLEVLNSYQEMEVVTLREKLGMPEDESVSTEHTVAKRKEEARKIEELVRQNKLLVEENLEMKSDIRTLKYKLYKSARTLDYPDSTVEVSTEFLHSTKLPEPEQKWAVESENEPYRKTDIGALKKNVQIVVEENEALRRGMHEILDSIRSQDGKSTVEVQSGTLERLLEALDVRHLAGWYHPAMRLQEHLNVVQGSNAELRSQLKQLRRELQRKDNILQEVALNKNVNIDKYSEDSENEKIMAYVSEIEKVQTAYQNEADEWRKQKESLVQQTIELKGTVDEQNMKIEVLEKDWQILESGEDEVKQSFAIKSRELLEARTEVLASNRKNAILEDLLNNESANAYQRQKDAAKKESCLKSAIAELHKRNKMLEYEIATLQSNLSNSVSLSEHKELQDKHTDVSVRYRALLESNTVDQRCTEVQALKVELEKVIEEKYELIGKMREDVDRADDRDLIERLKESAARELLEKQRADHATRLHEISQTQLKKCEASIGELASANTELQQQIAELHKRLSREADPRTPERVDDNKMRDLQDANATLKTENEDLKESLSIAREEAQAQYTLNSLKSLELDSLRHQILDLQAVSEDKAIISRLDFEITRRKASEMELNAQKIQLENEVARLQQELETSKSKCVELRASVQDCRKLCENRCKTFLEVTRFLQCQYAGSTSVSALERVAVISAKVQTDRENVKSEIKKVKESQDNVKLQQELLANRLQIVESLKEMLEQQIGSASVQEMMQSFSEKSQYILNDFKYKRRIAQLEYELEVANNKCMEYDSTILSMEGEMMSMQKVWGRWGVQQAGLDARKEAESTPAPKETKSVLVQVTVESYSRDVQTDPYACCLNKENAVDPTHDKPKEDIEDPKKDIDKESNRSDAKSVEQPKSIAENNSAENDSVAILSEQLNQALKLASERSAVLIKYESQITEYRAKVEALGKAIEEKDSQLAERDKGVDNRDTGTCSASVDRGDNLALKSTINSLQKIISQKEDTIERYQNLLKEDRDEHSRAAARLQEEIKGLHERVAEMQQMHQMHQEAKKPEENIDASSMGMDKVGTKKAEESSEKSEKPECKNRAVHEDEVARLRERVSTLDADLNITKELSERWHRLAEERLKHMDRMRERLEEQHKNELESYRTELNKWQSEADGLRKQLSENRMMLTKGNISLMKELQERDDKIHELSLACQQLQNEVELMESVNRSHRIAVQSECDSKMHEITSLSHDRSLQHQSQTDLVRRQLQSLMEKEKMYKHEIAELKQRLSRRYMAVKTQEKKASQREAQLERKVKSLEEELSKAQAQLDREYLAQEVKKAKTAEELSLWEKQKKWQQTAERLKEKLKEKTDECAKLNGSHEKLRAVVACMEREKWYLKSKLKSENATVAGNLSARPMSAAHNSLVNELQKECQTLRERVKELTDRLEREDGAQLLSKIEEQRRRIAALEAVAQGDSTVACQLQKLEMTKDVLEKANLKLESENLELRLELEKANSDTPRLREKVEHLERYVELLKVERSSDSSPRSLDKDAHEIGLKKSSVEMEKTIFTLKKIVEKLQAENKRLRLNSKKNHVHLNQGKTVCIDNETMILRQYEQARKRVVALETDLQLAEQRIAMLERAQKEEDSGEVNALKEQLLHKSELLDKVKHLLTRAAINEKNLRYRVQQLESRQPLSAIPECYVSPPTPQ